MRPSIGPNARIAPVEFDRPGAEVEITGHTDTVGFGADNDALSLKRAGEIRDALIALGLDRRSAAQQARRDHRPLRAHLSAN